MKRPLAAAACAAALVLAGCSDTSPNAADTELPEPSLAAPAEPSEFKLKERDPKDFYDEEFDTYAVAFSPRQGPDNACVYFEKGYFDCIMAMSGNLPPLDIDPGIEGQYAVLWEDDKGFTVTRSIDAGEGFPETEWLRPGETVTIGPYTFSSTDVYRVERGEHWFELGLDGQYSSDRFAPEQ